MKTRITFLAALLALTSFVRAATNTWDGEAGDGYWTNAVNWSGNVLPSANNVVIISNATTVSTLGVSGQSLPSGCQVQLSGGAGLNQPSGAVRLNSASISVGTNCSLLGAFWDLNNGTIRFDNGAKATFSDWEQKGTNTFRFNFGASGFTTLYPTKFWVSSAAQFTNATYVIDLASYAGGATNITLVDFTTVSSTAIITPNNFLLNAKQTILNPGVFTNSTIVYNASTLSIVAKISSTPIPPDKIWDGGGGDSYWTNSLNWNPDAIPVVNEIIGITNAVTVNGLGLTGSGSLPQNCNVSLSGDAGLTMSSGAIRLDGALINVASNSALSGAWWDLNNGTIRFDNGAKATFNDWEQKGNNTFSFKLGATNFTTLRPNIFRVATGASLSNATYNVDLAAYTGPAKTVVLVDFTNNSDSATINAANFLLAKRNILNPGNYTNSTITFDAATVAIVLKIQRNPGITWDGGGADLSWTTALNWDTDTVPTSADGVYIGSGMIVTNGQNTFSYLVIQTNTSVTFSADLVPGNVVTNAGTLGRTGGVLRLGNAAGGARIEMAGTSSFGSSVTWLDCYRGTINFNDGVSFAAAGVNFEHKGTNTFGYKLRSGGFNPLILGRLRSGESAVWSNATYNIDASAFLVSQTTNIVLADYTSQDAVFNGVFNPTVNFTLGAANVAAGVKAGLSFETNQSKLILTLSTNTPPVARNVTNSVAQGGSITITNNPGKNPFATDADADSLAFAKVSNPSAGIVTVLANGFQYTSTGSTSNTWDSFQYSASDAYGGAATNTVAIYIGSALGANLISATESNSLAYLKYAGVPSQSYVSQRATNLTYPITWTPVATNTAGATNSATPGMVFFTNTIVSPASFFRTQAQ